jgi:hypothetical protein
MLTGAVVVARKTGLSETAAITMIGQEVLIREFCDSNEQNTQQKKGVQEVRREDQKSK